MGKCARSRISTGYLMGKYLRFSITYLVLYLVGRYLRFTLYVLFAFTFSTPEPEERLDYFSDTSLYKNKIFGILTFPKFMQQLIYHK